MIGIIIKVLADMVTELTDVKTLTTIYQEAGVKPDKVYRLNEAYSDEEWQRVFNATLKIINLSQEEAYTVYADAFIKYAERMFPTWFVMAKTSRDFLLLQPIIHNSFASSMVSSQEKQKVQDKFRVVEYENTDDLTIFYQSPNKHCGLYIALAHRLAQKYGETLNITTKQCICSGEPVCEMYIQFNQVAVSTYD